MKLIAFYLPQFHRIPENDRWWGEGFTEWTNTKKAKPLYKGQYQPREPLNNNYYNLLDNDIKKWQADIAKQYGIYGFCYYHYWFKGKMLLQTPLQQMLDDRRIDLPFCISWANEPWARTWDGMENEVLMKQEYGNKDDWKEHFEYLLTIFKDDRYIKIDNKPMLVIYKVASIEHHEEMFKYWEELALENGFDGLHIVETLNGLQNKACSEKSKSMIYFEPNYTIHHDRPLVDKVKNKLKNICLIPKCGFKIYDTMDYDITWKRILKRDIKEKNKNIILGAFIDWDNTARKGDKALIFNGSTPEKFGKYLGLQVNRAKEKYKSEFLFINAWNEWAEGTYLEPDKKNGFRYLEEVKKSIDKERRK